MISEKTHPELARALNNMNAITGRDHTDKEWKQALYRVLAAFAVEIIHPQIPITDIRFGPVEPGPIDDAGVTMRKILENLEKRGPKTYWDDHGTCANRQMDESDPKSVGKPRMLSCKCKNCSPFSFA